ncbi:MAG TPA: hypothetical protein ENJ33_00585 [Thiothrix sp.]|nr:hypothetical protein [Thiothrix sp.]
MNNYNLLLTLGTGSISAFMLFFVFYKFLHWQGKMAALATAALMLLLYVPLAVTHWPGLDEFAIHFAFFMMVPYGLGIITGVHSERMRREGKKELEKGLHWIPALIIVFFILLAVVDSVIILFATKGVQGSMGDFVLPKSISGDSGEGRQSRFTGNVSYDFQNKEKQFDNYVKTLQKQRKLGWKIKGGWAAGQAILAEPALFELKVVDKANKPMSNATVSVDFIRASSMSDDQHYDLKMIKAGVYHVITDLPLAGCWQLRIIVEKGTDQYEIRGNIEVFERLDGTIVERKCAIGEPDMDSAR